MLPCTTSTPRAARINTLDVLRDKKAEWCKVCESAKDLQAWGTIKAAVAVRANELGGSVAA